MLLCLLERNSFFRLICSPFSFIFLNSIFVEVCAESLENPPQTTNSSMASFPQTSATIVFPSAGIFIGSLNRKETNGLSAFIQEIMRRTAVVDFGNGSLSNHSAETPSSTTNKTKLRLHRRKFSGETGGGTPPEAGEHGTKEGKRKCQKLTEREKYLRLEKIGGRNQQFMANSPEEAGRNFPVLIRVDFEPLFAFDDVDFENSDDFCGDECSEIRVKLGEAQKRRGTFGLLDEEPFDEAPLELEENISTIFDDGKAENDKHNVSSTKSVVETNGSKERRTENKTKKKKTSRKGCFLEEFVEIGNCTSHGKEEARGIEKLCTSCQGVHMLSKNCFPTFINSVVCDDRENECIFDRFSGSAQGRCREKMLTFKVMRNKGTERCEEWTFEYIEVPVACECYLSKDSIFLDAIPPEETTKLNEDFS